MGRGHRRNQPLKTRTTPLFDKFGLQLIHCRNAEDGCGAYEVLDPQGEVLLSHKTDYGLFECSVCHNGDEVFCERCGRDDNVEVEEEEEWRICYKCIEKREREEEEEAQQAKKPRKGVYK